MTLQLDSLKIKYIYLTAKIVSVSHTNVIGKKNLRNSSLFNIREIIGKVSATSSLILQFLFIAISFK